MIIKIRNEFLYMIVVYLISNHDVFISFERLEISLRQIGINKFFFTI